jgi:hypothetical protein
MVDHLIRGSFSIKNIVQKQVAAVTHLGNPRGFIVVMVFSEKYGGVDRNRVIFFPMVSSCAVNRKPPSSIPPVARIFSLLGYRAACRRRQVLIICLRK